MSFGGAWTGVGIDIYSSEEFGYIAFQCPHNPYAMHIMDNLNVQFTDDGLRITDRSHPYLKDYEIGDWAESVNCNCRIDLPAMSHVKGRIRNMMKLPGNKTIWPIFGVSNFPDLIRYQVFQESLTKLRFHFTGSLPTEAIEVIQTKLGYKFNIELVYGEFKPGKYEEFICEI
jgi:phenylacetate-coenzyme A ligase PaaK-like adenylate-forming protein